MDKFDEVNLA